MTKKLTGKTHELQGTAGVPLLWPVAFGTALLRAGIDLADHNLDFLAEELKLHGGMEPVLASNPPVRLALRTMELCDYGPPEANGMPTIVTAPYAGHPSSIADYDVGQSLMQVLRDGGVGPLYLTNWRSATPDMKDLEVDQYLAELLACVDDLGGRVNLVGLCQGGWTSAMLAARFPDKVASLVLAGSPIDTHAGDGPLEQMVASTPLSFYEQLVAAGGGRMPGTFMLAGWKSMHPEEHALEDVQLYEHLDDPAWLKRKETFERWYENTLDLPGRWYLQVIEHLFRNNEFARGEFVALGRRLDPAAIRCPLYLLAGAGDDITPAPQVFAAADLFETPTKRVRRETAPGGHIGLFMGSAALRDTWPRIAAW
ncbi:MAG: alpha/beta fold hydrolase, partial [Dermatophilaceae bacterium]